jgi:peptide/nickel transport system substrate-binding protein
VVTRRAGSTASATLLRLIALLLTLGLVAAACGGGDDGDETAEEDGGGDDGAAEPAPEDDGEPVMGGEVVYALEAETNGGYCLPEAQLAISGIQVARTLYDTLTAPNAEGEIEPYLAESVEPNDDFTQWTITPREGITFHDGTPLDAQIIADNINAWRGTYPARSPLLLLFVFQDVADVVATPEGTVVVTTKRPWVSFDWTLWNSSRNGIVGRAQLDADDTTCANNMVGTGPFMLENWTVNQELVAVKNPNYWQQDEAGNQLPYLDKITYRPVNEIAQRINALESGQLDMMHTSDTEQMADRLRPLAEAGDIENIESDAFGEVTYLMMNASVPPFDNKNARLAVSHALDREFLKEVRGGGIGEIANDPFAEDVMGHLGDEAGFPEFDVAKAEEAAAAYEEETGSPLSFTYSFVSSESGNLSAQEIQTQMADAGIDMEIQPVGDQATAINTAIAGEFEMIGWRNHPGADPDTQYNWWYEGSPVNFGRIADPEINRLLDEGRTTPEGREEIYQDLSRRFAEEAYNLWLARTIWSVSHAPDINGILGPTLPHGAGFPGLGTGHYVHGMWRAG